MSELVDTNVNYCDKSDVEFYIRTEVLQQSSTNVTDYLTDTQMDKRIDENSDKIDKKINTAFRTRRKSDDLCEVNLTYIQEKSIQSLLGVRNNDTMHRSPDRWVDIYTSKKHIQEVENITFFEVDGTSTLSSSDYRVVSAREGYIQVKLNALTNLVSTINVSFSSIGQFKHNITVTYTYGKNINDNNDHVIRKACAMYTAADIIATDASGDALPSDTELNLESTSSKLNNEADSLLSSYVSY